MIEVGSFDHFIGSAHRTQLLLHFCETGSRVICDPPVLDTDLDYLVYVRDLDEAGWWFSSHHWKNCFEDWEDKVDKDPGTQADYYTVEIADGARFQAWRRKEVNVIVTDDELLHLRSRAATLLAAQLNLQSKAERIALFRCIKFGETYGGRLA